MTNKPITPEEMKAYVDATWEKCQAEAWQEPVCAHEVEKIKCPFCRPLEQEPVAWMWADGTITTDPDRADGTWAPLYTAPSRREWVGLTDEEKHQLNDALNLQGRFRIIDAIEAKLKERNK